MATIDLQSLIDEVLKLAKDRQKQRSVEESNARASARENLQLKLASEQEAGERTSRTELEKQRLVNTGALDLQGARNAGELAVQGSRNIGEIARQGLMNVGNESVANIQAGASRYKADTDLEGHKLTSGATIEASKNRLAGDFERAQAERDKATIGLGLAKNDPISSFMTEAVKADPTIMSDPKRWKGAMENARSLIAKEPTADDDRKFFTSAPTPSLSPAPSLNPARTALTNTVTPMRSTPQDVPWNAKPPVFGETPKLGLNERTTIYTSPSLQEEEERNRKKKRLFGF